MDERSRFRLDLLRLPALRGLLLGPVFPYALQALVLLVFIALVAGGWGVGIGEDPAFLKTLRKTNAATLLVWGLWWPLMVLGAIALGRAWCTVCPMELVHHIAHRLGVRLGTARLPLPRFLRAGFGILALYLVLQILVGGAALHRVPGHTSLMMAAILGLALLTGLLVRDRRGFCHGLCPANLLLPVYGRLAPLEIDAADPSVCEACATKDCFRPDRLDRWHARSCPSRVRIFDRSKGDPCVACFQCAKACPYGNVGYGLAAPAAPSRRHPPLSAAEALLVLFVSGFVMHELFTEIKPLEWIYHAPADRFHALLGPAVPWDWIHTAWYLVIFPAILWASIVGIARLAGARGAWTTVFRHAATAAFPIVAAAHAAKALAKLNSWGAHLPVSFAEPNGVAAARAIVAGARPAPGLLVPFHLVGFLAILLAVMLAASAWRRAREMPQGTTTPARVGVAAAAILYVAVLVAWPLMR